MTKTNPKICGQCGKPAVSNVGDVLLCVDCYAKLVNADTAARNTRLQWMRHSMAMANLAMEEMESISGIPGIGPRIRIPTMPTVGSVTLNNIKLDNSVVGAINTGNVRDIDVNLTELHKTGDDEAKEALRSLTQAVISDASLSVDQKNELLDQIAFVSDQATKSAKDRKPGVIKASFSAIAQGAATVASVAAAWQAAAPILGKLFGFP